MTSISDSEEEKTLEDSSSWQTEAAKLALKAGVDGTVAAAKLTAKLAPAIVKGAYNVATGDRLVDKAAREVIKDGAKVGVGAAKLVGKATINVLDLAANDDGIKGDAARAVVRGVAPAATKKIIKTVVPGGSLAVAAFEAAQDMYDGASLRDVAEKKAVSTVCSAVLPIVGFAFGGFFGATAAKLAEPLVTKTITSTTRGIRSLRERWHSDKDKDKDTGGKRIRKRKQDFSSIQARMAYVRSFKKKKDGFSTRRVRNQVRVCLDEW